VTAFDASFSTAFGNAVVVTPSPVCLWITTTDVAESLGAPVLDSAWLDACTKAANAYAFRKRAQFGYTDDPVNVPGPDVHTGTVLYAQSLYRERGGLMDASYAELALPADPSLIAGMSGQVNRLLGIPRIVTG
jgi:hypothetical protein